MTRLTGQFFLAPTRVFFLCESQKGGLAIALGKGLGGLVGGAIAALVTHSRSGAGDRRADVIPGGPTNAGIDGDGAAAVQSIKYTMWTRGIFYGGNTYALRDGLSKDLRQELGLWCQANNVMAKGLLK